MASVDKHGRRGSELNTVDEDSWEEDFIGNGKELKEKIEKRGPYFFLF